MHATENARSSRNVVDWIEAYHEHHTKPKTIIELTGNAADDLGQPASNTDRQSCKEEVSYK